MYNCSNYNEFPAGLVAIHMLYLFFSYRIFNMSCIELLIQNLFPPRSETILQNFVTVVFVFCTASA